MATLVKIKSLKTNNFDMLDLLGSFITQDISTQIYNPNKTYQKDDIIIRPNPQTGMYEFLRAKETTTGAFNASKWTNETLQTNIRNAPFIRSVIELSRTKPVDQGNLLWLDRNTSNIPSSNAVQAVQKFRNVDGSYTIVFPFTSSDEVIVDKATGRKLTDKLNEIDNTILADRLSDVDDMLTIVNQLSSFFPRPVQLNHVFIDDISNTDTFTISNGIYLTGRVVI